MVDALIFTLALAVVVAVALVIVVWRRWLHVEQQRERLRQAAWGGGADMPSWARIQARRRR